MTKFLFTEGRTDRGFEIVRWFDAEDNDCSLQESSKCVCEDEDGRVADPRGYVWLGLDDVNPHTEVGGEIRSFPIPTEVSLNSRMHLDEHQVVPLMDALRGWADGLPVGRIDAIDIYGAAYMLEAADQLRLGVCSASPRIMMSHAVRMGHRARSAAGLTTRCRKA